MEAHALPGIRTHCEAVIIKGSTKRPVELSREHRNRHSTNGHVVDDTGGKYSRLCGYINK